MTVHNPTARRATRIGARTGATLSVAMLLLSTWAVLVGTRSPASAAPTNAGDATIVTPISTLGGGDPITTGGSKTQFTIKLPHGAACKGDSANDGYRWQTYMVPSSVDPSSLQFDNTGPAPNTLGNGFRQPLYDPAGSPVNNMQTSNADTPPGPGPILNIPNFDFEVYMPGNVPAGDYNVGVACTLGAPSATQLDRWWNAQLRVAANTADSPAQIGFTVLASQSTTTSSSLSSSTSSTTAGSGDSSTTSTTQVSGGGGDSTTSSTSAGDTSTTSAGSSDTSGSSTSLGDTSTTTDYSTTSGSTTNLARTGSSPESLAVWAFLAVVFGRMAVLLGRAPLDDETAV